MVPAFGEEDLLISVTDTSEDIIFDGKWSFEAEWKHSSLTKIENEAGTMMIRYSHDRENIYVLLDVLSDKIKSHLADRAIICFDTKVDGGSTIMNDDYCFVSAMDSNNAITLQGGANSINTGHMKKISNHPELIISSSFSDENDRYSKIPHASYEFKIPLEIISVSNVYGFYIQVYDNDNKQYLTWPEDNHIEKYPHIAPPKNWGKIISPDKSIPEFSLPYLVLVLSLLGIIFFTFQKKYSFLEIKV